MFKRKTRARRARRTAGPRMTPGDIRLNPEDRPGGAVGGRRKAKASAKAPARGRGGQRKTARRGTRSKPRRSLIGRLFRTGFVLGIWAFVAALAFVGWHAMHLPPPEELSVPERPANIMIVASDGSVIGNRGETGGEEVSLFELPEHLPQAVVAIEDRRFYSHFGVDPIGLVRAAAVNLMAGGVVQGGSTLTQQLAKNLFLKPDRTMRRKVQELMIALWLEYKYSKEQILEMYLNRVYLGAGATGVEAAARVYFGKSARNVTLPEAAMIAGLLRAPSRYAPTNDYEAAENRAQTVIAAMRDAGFITQDQAMAAIAEPARVVPVSGGGSNGYVADWVAEQVPQLLGEVREDIVVETTISSDLQKTAENALIEAIDNAGDRSVSEGVVVALDPDGAVRALVGGRSYMESQYNRAVKAKRQPGSAFKPFVYLAAVEAGLTPDTVRNDAPVRFGNWSPSNYGNDYDGPITLTDALARSVNTVAAQLIAEVGPDRVIDVAHRMGIDTPIKQNLSIALGTEEVVPIDMISAFAPFANGGFGVEPYVVRRIRTTEGDLLYESGSVSRGRVVSQEALGAMNYMMRRTVEAGTGRAAAFGGWPAAGKTGTSQDFRDAWFIGYTANMIAGVWMGNDNNSPTGKVTGGNLPAQVWKTVMEEAHEGVVVADLPGRYVPRPEPQMVDRGFPFPWMQGGGGAVAQRADPSQPAPPSGQGGGFRIDGGFLKRLFGG